MSVVNHVSGVVRVSLDYVEDFNVLMPSIFKGIYGTDYWWCENTNSKSCLLRFTVEAEPEIFNSYMREFLSKLPSGAGIEFKVDSQWSLRNINSADISS